jgi:hypothetical protein
MNLLQAEPHKKFMEGIGAARTFGEIGILSPRLQLGHKPPVLAVVKDMVSLDQSRSFRYEQPWFDRFVDKRHFREDPERNSSQPTAFRRSRSGSGRRGTSHALQRKLRWIRNRL